MDRRNYYYKKKIDTSELEDLQNNIENADKSIVKNIIGAGIIFGLTVTKKDSSTVTVAAGIGYDGSGNKIEITSNIDVSLSSYIPSSNQIYIALTLVFSRNNSQQETDGNGTSQYFKLDESYTVTPVAGINTASPTVPSITSSNLLLVDILLNSSGIVSLSTSRVTKFNSSLNKLIDIFNYTDNKITLEAVARSDADLTLQENMDDVESILLANINTRALDSGVLHLSGAENVLGNKTFSGNNVFTKTNRFYGATTGTGYNYFGNNIESVIPDNVYALALGWNFSSGEGEVDFINCSDPSIVTETGFRFIQRVDSSTVRQLLRLKHNGTIYTIGNVEIVNTSGLNASALGVGNIPLARTVTNGAYPPIGAYICLPAGTVPTSIYPSTTWSISGGGVYGLYASSSNGESVDHQIYVGFDNIAYKVFMWKRTA
jgi:hypothetical protein